VLKRVSKLPAFNSMDCDDVLKSEVVLKCGKDGADVSISYNGSASPSPLWLRLAAALGSATTGASKAVVALAVRLCIQKALASTGETGDGLTLRIKVDCGAFTHDGGGDVDIYIPTEDERQ